MPRSTSSVLLAALLAAVGLLAGLVMLLPGPALAAGACTTHPRNRLVPYLTAPCDGASVRRRHVVVFTVHDSDPKAASQAPYLDLQTSRSIVNRHLSVNTDGNGIFAQMSAVTGHADTWTLTARREIYASWWDNTPGTYYVQVDQVDPRAASGILYGPITTVRVPAPKP